MDYCTNRERETSAFQDPVGIQSFLGANVTGTWQRPVVTSVVPLLGPIVEAV